MEHHSFYASYREAVDAVRRFALLNGYYVNVDAYSEAEIPAGERMYDRIRMRNGMRMRVVIANIGGCFEVNLELSKYRRNFVETI